VGVSLVENSSAVSYSPGSAAAFCISSNEKFRIAKVFTGVLV
jgi:hypothetical protein